MRKMKSINCTFNESERDYLLKKIAIEESYLNEMLDETRSEYYDEAYRKNLKKSLEKVASIKAKLEIEKE